MFKKPFLDTSPISISSSCPEPAETLSESCDVTPVRRVCDEDEVRIVQERECSHHKSTPFSSTVCSRAQNARAHLLLPRLLRRQALDLPPWTHATSICTWAVNSRCSSIVSTGCSGISLMNIHGPPFMWKKRREVNSFSTRHATKDHPCVVTIVLFFCTVHVSNLIAWEIQHYRRADHPLILKLCAFFRRSRVCTP